MAKVLAVFLATLPLLVVPGNDNAAQLPQSVWLLFGTLLLWLLHLDRPGPLRLRRSPLTAPFVAILAWAVLVSSWSGIQREGIHGLARWGAAALLFVLVHRTIDSAPRARLLLLALLVAACGVSIAGLFQHLGGWEGLPQAYPPAGTLANKNVAAGFVALAVPIGAVGFATASARASWIHSSALALTGAYLIHAGTRAAWLAVLAQALALAGLLVMRRRALRLPRSKWPALAFGVALFASLTSVPSATTMTPSSAKSWEASLQPVLGLLRGERGRPAPEGEAEPPNQEARAARSVEIRLAVWRNSLEMLREAPLRGTGLGNFAVEYPRFAHAAVPDGTRIDQRVEAAHNDYLQLAVELGGVGAAILSWFAVAALRVLARAAKRTREEPRMLCLASGLGLLALAVLAAVSTTIDQPAVLAAAATFLGVSTAFGTRALDDESSPEPQAGCSTTGLWLARAATAAALAIAGYAGHAEMRADRHVLSMGRAQVEQDWPAVIREGLAARRWNPWREEPLFAIASASLRLGQPERAVPPLQRLLADNPNHASALGNLGTAYLALGDLARAAHCFQRVLWLRGQDRLARLRLEQIRRLSGGVL